jgi:AmmeMemoRadiSam system protein B
MSWSLLLSGAYQTPLGEVPIDERLASALQARCPFLTTDPFAQRGEHAVEVLLPFLQRRGPADLSIVPIIANAGDPSEFAHLANVLADIIRRENEPVLLIASSDLSHAEPQDRVAASDRLLMDAIQSLDGARLLRIVHERSVRMCGAAVVACILEATRALGATQARLVRYSTSAEAGGDPASATGYAGFVIS